MIVGIRDAIEIAANAGDPKVTSDRASFNPPVTDRTLRDREQHALQVIKRFCEHMSPETTVEDILESIEDMEGS